MPESPSKLDMRPCHSGRGRRGTGLGLLGLPRGASQVNDQVAKEEKGHNQGPKRHEMLGGSVTLIGGALGSVPTTGKGRNPFVP